MTIIPDSYKCQASQLYGNVKKHIFLNSSYYSKIYVAKNCSNNPRSIGTIFCIVVGQMKTLRALWFMYENKGVWKEKYLREFRRVSLTALIREIGVDVMRVKYDVFDNFG